MKHFSILVTSLLLCSAVNAQSLYKWKLHIGAGTILYKGDIGVKKGINGKPAPSLHLAIERRFSYGVAAKLGFDRGVISANDRTTGSNKIMRDNPNFSRSLNFRSRLATSYIQFVYYADNGYLMKENARFAPFVFAGLGLTNFRTWVDQLYGPSNLYKYNYGDLNGNVRDPNISANAQLQDGVYETEVTKLQLEEKKYKNTAVTIPLGIGMNTRFTDRWSAQISASMILPLTDHIDGVSGKVNPNMEPTNSNYYLANPGGLSDPNRGDKSGKKDKLYQTTLCVNYNFGGNYYDKGPVVQAKDTNTYVSKSARDAYSIDPFDESAVATVKPKRGNFTLKEKEDMVLFTNRSGRKDTMYIMKMDTVYYADAGDASPSYASSLRGDVRNPSATPKHVSSYPLEESYTTLKPTASAQGSGVDASVIQDIYTSLQKLTTSLTSIDERVKQIENTIASSASLKSTNALAVAAPAPALESSSVFDQLESVVIYYGYGGFTLDEKSITKLNTVAEILKKYPNVGVALNAFADPSGGTALNMNLSQKRAASVRTYLTSLGVKSYQILAQYHGADTDKGVGDPQKRRVEVEFIKVR